jgi:hypothetical protein
MEPPLRPPVDAQDSPRFAPEPVAYPQQPRAPADSQLSF